MSTAVTRIVRKLYHSRSTLEGAGVRLKRAFGYAEVPTFDPFLLLDDFNSSDPDDYRAGFPWHPHRGIETVTYILEGTVAHGDSLGNSGVIGAGDVQWMTAGSGIVHQEMPYGDDLGRMWGFQLWVNLPASNKMMDPRYREVKAEQIPQVVLGTGARAKVIAGEVDGVRGPVRDIVTDPEYLDVTLPKGSSLVHAVRRGHQAFAYVIDGWGSFGGVEPVRQETVVHFGDGDQVLVAAPEAEVRFLLISGRPLGEPVAWQGPIVMNTDDELRLAFQEYRDGTFLKTGGGGS